MWVYVFSCAYHITILNPTFLGFGMVSLMFELTYIVKFKHIKSD